jgi:CHAD domain-containing protein
VKPRKVKGLDAKASVARNAARIVRVRIDELYGFDPAVLDPERVTELHDMRIAAKRLRYVLEIAGHCVPVVGAEAETVAKSLQEVLGEIHDCDVMLDRIAVIRDRDPAGFDALAARFRTERHEHFTHFCELWSAIEQSRLRERLLAHTILSPADAPVGA